MTNQALIDVDDVTKAFPAQEGGVFTVLDHVNLHLEDGEILAVLGKSGSGKSTLLRCLAGLIAPTSGTVRYRGQELTGVNPGVGMVFQSFGLMPWLDVQENVELGLRARGMARPQRAERAEELIDVIGLAGFENAYPRELSGGMRQRVGFARALVTQPDALLMDEPFSALDVLTAENLRSEIVRLWSEPDFPTKSICIVTHNIEEAVLLADRVVVMGSNPGRVRHETRIDLPRPRDRRSEAFQSYVDELYAVLTGQQVDAAPATATPANTPLPQASVGGMAGLVSMVAGGPNGGDLADLAAALNFEVDDLLPLVDGATMLGLLSVTHGQATVTGDGLAWAHSGIDEGKRLFGRLAAEHAPLVHAICAALDSSDDGELRLDLFRDLLRRSFPHGELEDQLAIAIDWGRHGELFDLEPDDEVLSRAA